MNPRAMHEPQSSVTEANEDDSAVHPRDLTFLGGDVWCGTDR